MTRATGHAVPPGAYIPAALSPAAAADFTTGRHAAHQTWFERADAPLQAALRRAPDAPLVLAYAALVGRFLGRDESVSIERVSVLATDAGEPEAAMAHAVARLAARDNSGALRHAEAFVRMESTDPYGRHAVGFLLTDVGRPADAIPLLEQLLADRPDFTPALNHLGHAQSAVGDVAAAVATLGRFVEAEPDNPSARDSLAEVLHATGDAEAAIGQLVRAVLIEPRFAFGWVHIGEILEARGEPAAAVGAYEAARLAGGAYGFVFHADITRRVHRLKRPGAKSMR